MFERFSIDVWYVFDRLSVDIWATDTSADLLSSSLIARHSSHIPRRMSLPALLTWRCLLLLTHSAGPAWDQRSTKIDERRSSRIDRLFWRSCIVECPRTAHQNKSIEDLLTGEGMDEWRRHRGLVKAWRHRSDVFSDFRRFSQMFADVRRHSQLFVDFRPFSKKRQQVFEMVANRENDVLYCLAFYLIFSALEALSHISNDRSWRDLSLRIKIS